jgi:hypothetical protein
LRRLTAAHGFSSHETASPAPLRAAANPPAHNESDGDMEEESAPAPEFVLSAATVDSLESLAVLLAVRELCSNHLVFYLGSLKMVPRSKELLAEYAALMKRHPRCMRVG